jgi:2,4-dienoyl-CoA reductase-like NADH-dependent reductase (Old Yellow Enzyme family)
MSVSLETFSNVGKQIEFLCLVQARNRGLKHTSSSDRRVLPTITNGEFVMEFCPESLASTVRFRGEEITDRFSQAADLVTHARAFTMNAEWVWNLYHGLGMCDVCEGTYVLGGDEHNDETGIHWGCETAQVGV